jgi:hypothetical protein
MLRTVTDTELRRSATVHADLHGARVDLHPPPLSPARGPPQGDFLLDQTLTFDPADAEPEPDFHFDQSLPPGFDD